MTKRNIGAFFLTLSTCTSFFCAVPAHAAWSLPTALTPVMRVMVGVLEVDTAHQFTSHEGRFIVHTASQDVWCEETKENLVSVEYADGTYTVACTSGTFQTQEPVQVTSKKKRKRVSAETFENRPSWNTALNDNYFYGSLEVVYSQESEQLVLVNELPIEKYVRGIAEAGDENDADYLQALMTAARTYAWYNIQHPTKHGGEPYILNATEGDQVYRGAGFSDRAPNIVAAQIATKKQVITYEDETIVAPFFSHSDGRTRSWNEVWSGEYAWASSVEDPCCSEYDALLGHGVGLSAEGARYFAELGWDWQTILKYYYTGVEIQDGY